MAVPARQGRVNATTATDCDDRHRTAEVPPDGRNAAATDARSDRHRRRWHGWRATSADIHTYIRTHTYMRWMRGRTDGWTWIESLKGLTASETTGRGGGALQAACAQRAAVLYEGSRH